MGNLAARVSAALAALSALACTACGPEFGEEHTASLQESLTWVGDLSGINFSAVPMYSKTEIKALFERARDIRWLADPLRPGTLRRISWLYPDGGCESRAELISHQGVMLYGPSARPYKLFVLGDMNPVTSYSPDGFVHWGHHVAPVVRDDEGAVWVIDPGVDLFKALPLDEWHNRIDPSAAAAYGLDSGLQYSPTIAKTTHEANYILAREEQESRNVDCVADNSEHPLLVCEELRLFEMRLPALSLMGDYPPWSKPVLQYFVSDELILSACDGCALDRCPTDCY